MPDKLQPDSWFQAILYKAWLSLQDWKYQWDQDRLKRKIDRQRRKQ